MIKTTIRNLILASTLLSPFNGLADIQLSLITPSYYGKVLDNFTTTKTVTISNVPARSATSGTTFIDNVTTFTAGQFLLKNTAGGSCTVTNCPRVRVYIKATGITAPNGAGVTMPANTLNMKSLGSSSVTCNTTNTAGAGCTFRPTVAGITILVAGQMSINGTTATGTGVYTGSYTVCACLDSNNNGACDTAGSSC